LIDGGELSAEKLTGVRELVHAAHQNDGRRAQVISRVGQFAARAFQRAQLHSLFGRWVVRYMARISGPVAMRAAAAAGQQKLELRAWRALKAAMSAARPHVATVGENAGEAGDVVTEIRRAEAQLKRLHQQAVERKRQMTIVQGQLQDSIGEMRHMRRRVGAVSDKIAALDAGLKRREIEWADDSAALCSEARMKKGVVARDESPSRAPGFAVDLRAKGEEEIAEQEARLGRGREIVKRLDLFFDNAQRGGIQLDREVQQLRHSLHVSQAKRDGLHASLSVAEAAGEEATTRLRQKAESQVRAQEEGISAGAEELQQLNEEIRLEERGIEKAQEDLMRG
jgi:chromosome segregation ATPase